jgi:hypothetical protein
MLWLVLLWHAVGHRRVRIWEVDGSCYLATIVAAGPGFVLLDIWQDTGHGPPWRTVLPTAQLGLVRLEQEQGALERALAKKGRDR